MTNAPALSADSEPRITIDRFKTLLAGTTPMAAFLRLEPERIDHGHAVVRLPFSPAVLRPGGTHGGPALMALIDFAMYAAVLSVAGEDPRPLTTQLATEFLRRPPNRDLLADCRIIGIDGTLAVGRIAVHAEGEEDTPVCTATCTYALPPP